MIYWITVVILKAIRIGIWPFCRITIIGTDNVPFRGAVAIAGKHISPYFDVPIIGISLWRQVHFMARDGFFQFPIADWWMRAVGAFPVKRGKADRVALRQGITILKERRVLGVFPEGTTKNQTEDTLGKTYDGLAFMINHCEVKPFIIPVAINYGRGFPRNIKVVFGEPVSCATNDRKQLTDNIRVGIEHALADASKVSEDYVTE